MIDYDDPNSSKRNFWNLSHKQTFFGNASELVGFRLMPLEPQFRKAISAQWTFKVVDETRRVVAFRDTSEGEVTGWKWDFGDGTSSIEQNPSHRYEERPGRPGIYTVILDVTGPAGTSRMAKVWDVHVR